MSIENLINWFEHKVSFGVYYWAVLEMEFWWLWGIIGGVCAITALFQQRLFLVLIGALGFVFSLLIQPFLYLYLPELSSMYLSETYHLEDKHLYAYAVGFLLAAVIWFFTMQQLVVWLEVVRRVFTKTTDMERDTRTDIRDIERYLPKPSKPYDPESFFNKKEMFCGVDERGKPVYIPKEIWRSSHIDIMGTTGSGKGVCAGVLLTQAINQGEAVFVIDPKNDEYLPHVMGLAAKKAGVPFYYIDLLGHRAQWNPFAKKTIFEIEELMSAGFGLEDRDSDADVYRLKDRTSARAFANEMVGKPQRMSSVLAALMQTKSAVLKESPKLQENLEEVASMPVVNIDNGIDLKAAIERGGVVYIRGSMRNPRVRKLQKMFVLSVMQHCESRDRDTARHTCLFLDEFKYLLSKPALEALGAIRDKRAHVMLAHQSLGDLRDCPKDMDPESVVSSVNENCSLKFSYKVNDPNTADWLARMSGQKLIDDESRSFSTGTAMTETRDPERKLRQMERCLIDTNMLQSLPKSCAALYGNGLASFIFTSPIKVKKSGEYITPTHFDDEKTLAEVGVEPTSDTPFKATTIAEELVNVD